MPTASTIWKRRAVLMAIVGLLVGVPVTLLLTAGDDDPEDGRTPATAALNPTVIARKLGVEYRVPEGWDASSRPGLILLDGPDETTRLAISAPAGASASKRVRTEALEATRAGYEDVEVRPGSGKAVGGLRASGALVRARNPEGTPLEILIAVMEGKEFTYLVQLFIVEGAPSDRVAEAQSALNELRLTK